MKKLVNVTTTWLTTSAPAIIETAYIFTQIDLPSTRNRIVLKPLSRADQDHVHTNPDKK